MYVEIGFGRYMEQSELSLEYQVGNMCKKLTTFLITVPGVVAWNYGRRLREHSLQPGLGVEAWTYIRSPVDSKSLRIECVYTSLDSC